MNRALFILDLNNKSATTAIKFAAAALNVLALMNHRYEDYFLPHKSNHRRSSTKRATAWALSLLKGFPLIFLAGQVWTVIQSLPS